MIVEERQKSFFRIQKLTIDLNKALSIRFLDLKSSGKSALVSGIDGFSV